MSLFPEVAKNTFAQGLGRAGVVLIAIFTTALLTRILGVSGYGTYVFVIALVMFFVSIADWGTTLIFVRESVRNREEEEKFYSNAFILRFFLSVVAVALINFLALFPVFLPLSLPLKIASILLVLISLKTTCHIIFQTKSKFEYMALTDVAISLVFLILLGLVFLLSRSSLTLSWIIMAFVLANLLGAIIAFFLALSLAKISFQFSKVMVRKIILEALPTGALLLIFSIYNRLDIFLLQIIRGSEPVGIYGLAYKVHDNLILGSAYLAAALFPVISSLAAKPDFQERLQTIYRKIFDILFMAGFFVLISVFFLAPVIISIIGGSQFTQSVSALRILVFGTFLAYFNHLTGYTLVALGKQKVSLVVAVIALIWNLSLNLILIPHYSYLAAAVVTIATEGLVLVLTSFYLARNFSLYPNITFPKTFIELIKTRGKIF